MHEVAYVRSLRGVRMKPLPKYASAVTSNNNLLTEETP